MRNNNDNGNNKYLKCYIIMYTIIYEGDQSAVQYCADHKLHIETLNYTNGGGGY